MNARDRTAPDDAALRAPPWSCEAEQSVLGGLLLDNRALDQAAELIDARHFFDSRHAGIFAAISRTIVANKPADVITINEALGKESEGIGGLRYLNALASSVPSAANTRRYAEIVREHAQQRALIAAADKSLGIAWDDGEPRVKLERIAGLFAQLQRAAVKRQPQRLGDLLAERVERYSALSSGELAPGWPTGIEWLDQVLSGGLRAGSVYVIASRPSVGKSSLAVALGIHFARQGLPTLMLSQEMPDAEVADRAISHLADIGYSMLQTGRLDEFAWSALPRAVDEATALPFWIDDEPALTLLDIRTKARLVKGLRVLVVDYLQLCSSTLDSARRNDQIEEISRGLKALAKEMGLAVVALSQLNRRVEDRTGKRPQLSDLRDSGAVEQDGDVVMLLWLVREFKHEGRKIVGLAVEKNRQGLTGEIGLDFYGAVHRWTQSTADITPDRPRAAAAGGFD